MPADPSAPVVRAYRLDLAVDHESLAISGRVEIELAEAVRELTLNAVGLEASAPDAALVLTPRPTTEEIHLRLAAASDRITLDFRGAASDRSLVGLYRSRFGEGHILTTQCATTSARRIFPCLDRPDRKAVVHLRLTISEGLEAIFNTPVVRSSQADGRQTLEFAPTPPMATYLVYLGIGQFDWFRGPTERTRVAAAAPPGRGAAGRYAVERAREILPAFERYFGLPYPLEKLDLIAVPEFAYGAMENWGAISFREMRLLVDPQTSAQQRRDTLETIAHEIAHQWFGNLVTMAWWTDIWLNESFATLMEEKVIESLYPDLRALDDLLLAWTGPALVGDSLPVTHPIRVPVERPEEIDQIFDEISYGKGSAVLRMFDGFIGPELFQRGVNDYLRRHAGGNATSDDLWDALERAYGRPLRPMLADWIDRPGLPIVRASLSDGRVVLDQRRFSLDGRHAPERWPVPIVASIDGATRRHLLDGERGELPVTTERPVHLNVEALGFYRVLYDRPLYDRLRAGFATRSPAERWSVVQDLFAFLLSGDVGRERYYEFLQASRGEEDYLVVVELANQLSSTSPGRQPTPLGALLGGEPHFRREATDWLGAQIDRLGLEPRPGESEEVAMVRGRVASSLAALDGPFARRLVEAHGGGRPVPPDLRWPVLLARAQDGSGAEFDRLLEELRLAPSEGDALRYERAIARFREPSLVERALAAGRGPLVNRAHLASLVREAALNPAGRPSTWSWIRTTLHEIEPDYRGTGTVGQILESAMPFAALGHLEEARRELEARPFNDGDRGARKGLVYLERYERLLAGR